MSFYELNGVGKSFVTGAIRQEVLADVNLHVREGEFIAIVGFSEQATIIALDKYGLIHG